MLNQPAYAAGSVLVAGPDFGTGSSREHAVWALKDYGFRVVISSRFADIFRGNSGKQGLLAAQVEPERRRAHLEAPRDDEPGTEVTVDLQLTHGDVRRASSAAFEVDDYTRWRLLEGLDDIGLTLRHEAEASAFESKRPRYRSLTTIDV